MSGWSHRPSFPHQHHSSCGCRRSGPLHQAVPAPQFPLEHTSHTAYLWEMCPAEIEEEGRHDAEAQSDDSRDWSVVAMGRAIGPTSQTAPPREHHGRMTECVWKRRWCGRCARRKLRNTETAWVLYWGMASKSHIIMVAFAP